MRIFQINCVPNGSTGKIASEIHKKLLAMGHESYFAYGTGSSNLKNTYRISNWFDIHIHSYMGKIAGREGFFSVICTLKLLRLMKKVKPDLVHLHNLHGSYINVPQLMRYLKKNRIKTVWTLHDCWGFTGKCPHYTEVKCDKWKTACGNCPQVKRYPVSYWFDTSKALYKKKKKMFGDFKELTVITVSDWLKSQAEMSFLSRHSIKRIYNGIDTEVFSPVSEFDDINAKYNIPKEAFTILGVASGWNENKGLGVFLEIAKQLRKDEKIVLVGLSKEQIEKMPDNIIGINRTDNQRELAKIYSRAGVLLNPSLEETFGLVAAEAMACQTPVITSTSTACPEIITESSGISLDMGDINGILNAIGYIKENREKFSNTRKIVTDNYTIERMTDEYIFEYEAEIRKVTKNG